MGPRSERSRGKWNSGRRWDELWILQEKCSRSEKWEPSGKGGESWGEIPYGPGLDFGLSM